MAAVLNDGSPAALRALELATIPGFLINHEEQQLIILHGLAESKDPAQHQSIPAALDVIGKSRVAQNTLNYKIEMRKVVSFEAPGAISAGGSPTPGPGATPGPGDKPSAKAGKKPEVKAPAVSDAPPAPAKPDKSPEEIAEAVADFCDARCEHHGIRTVLLGVGSAMQGKSIAVGSVAKEIVDRFRSRGGRRLLFLKSTGPVIRPTAALRMVVLVVPEHPDPIAHLRQTLEMCSTQGRGDRVGVLVVANNGRPKPAVTATETVVSMDDIQSSEAAAGQSATVTRQCVELLGQFGLRDASTGYAADEGASVAQETFPLMSQLVLEPTNQLPTPTVDDVPNQLIKTLAGFKCDFLVLPPAAGEDPVIASDQLALACLAAPKPHVMLL